MFKLFIALVLIFTILYFLIYDIIKPSIVKFSNKFWKFFGLKDEDPSTIETTNSEENKVNKLDFYEIEKFNEEDYVADIFDTIFYSIQNEDWKVDIQRDHILCVKKTILVKFDYGLETNQNYNKKLFKITTIKLKDDVTYDSFYFNGDLPESLKKFLYSIYSDYMNNKNKENKEKVDRNLKNIKEVIGISSERGAKLDQLLG